MKLAGGYSLPDLILRQCEDTNVARLYRDIDILSTWKCELEDTAVIKQGWKCWGGPWKRAGNAEDEGESFSQSPEVLGGDSLP